MSQVLNLKQKINTEVLSSQDGEVFPVVQKKKRRFSGVQWLIAVIAVVVLSTAGIKASDSLFGAKGQVKSLCPDGMVFVPGSSGGFCLDKYEDSAGGCPSGNPGSQDDTRTDLENQACSPVSVAGMIPWRFISQNQAALACAKVGKRLPTSEEWLAGALATPDKNSLWGLDDCQVNNNWREQPGLTGSGKNCVSGVGAYDMIGNIWEWVAGTVEDGKYNGEILPAEGYIKSVNSVGMPTDTNLNQADLNYNNDYLWIKNTGSRGIARGGYWANNDQAGQYSAYIVTAPSDVGPGMGFRCAK
jgi:hypothetical protein